MSGLEIAMWDLAGKAWGVPLWQMLGGKFRDKVRVYCDTDVDGKHTGTDMGKALKNIILHGLRILHHGIIPRIMKKLHIAVTYRFVQVKIYIWQRTLNRLWHVGVYR